MSERLVYVACVAALLFVVGLWAGRAETPDPTTYCGPYTEAVVIHDDGAIDCIPG